MQCVSFGPDQGRRWVEDDNTPIPGDALRSHQRPSRLPGASERCPAGHVGLICICVSGWYFHFLKDQGGTRPPHPGSAAAALGELTFREGGEMWVSLHVCLLPGIYSIIGKGNISMDSAKVSLPGPSLTPASSYNISRGSQTSKGGLLGVTVPSLLPLQPSLPLRSHSCGLRRPTLPFGPSRPSSPLPPSSRCPIPRGSSWWRWTPLTWE